jgi:branched-chain amino acid transport system permease protein
MRAWAARALRLGWPVGLVVLLAFVPTLDFGLGQSLPGALSSPGTLQLLALCLLFGGVALSYDLLFGFTGLLSFGHALYFAIGLYIADIAITQWHWAFGLACVAAAASGIAVATIVGLISLRTSGIAFAMVTLAFAQAGSILVQKNPHSWTGGEQGLGYDYTRVPATFVGVANTKSFWQAIRENERRVEVLGLRTRGYKLLSFVLGSFLATCGGIVYLLVVGGADMGVTTADFTLALLLMVVLGGTGTIWGPLLGGVVYTYANQRLVALGDSHAVQSLPDVLRTPLSQPLFVLGMIFILVVFFLPGGLVGLAAHGRRGTGGLRRLGGAFRSPADEPQLEDLA